MTVEELFKEIETQYNLYHKTKIKVTLPEEIKQFELCYYEQVDDRPYPVTIETVQITQLTNRIILK